MPAPPEIGDARGEIREVEVAGQFEPEPLRATHGHVGVAGEVAVDLRRPSEAGPTLRRQIECTRIREHRRHEQLIELIRDEHLLEQPQQEKVQPLGNLLRRHRWRRLHLRQKLDRPHDRTRGELREERHEEGVIEEAPHGLDLPAIHVHRVADALKRVEADADRQEDFPGAVVDARAAKLREGHCVIEGEHRVLEREEQPEVRGNAQEEPPLSGALASASLDPQCREVIDDRAGDDDPEILRAEPRVKEPASREEDAVFVRAPPEQVVEHQHGRKENEERLRGEDHPRRL